MSLQVSKTSNLIRNNFSKIVKNASSLTDTPELMYHIKRKKEGLKSFDGYNHCGALCLSTYVLLLKNGYDNCKVVHSVFGYGKSFEDHVFIELEDNIIIDPSYKQFLRFNYNHNDLYQNTLYDCYDDCFVGSKNELYKRFCNFIKLDAKVYGEYGNDINDIKYFYEYSKCHTELYDKNINLVHF
jgi:hypothetical protein